jgi:hypothetical protein
MPNSKRRSVAVLVLGANLVLWVTLAAEFFSRSEPYHPHSPQFEEQMPIYQFGGRALPVSAESRCWSLWVVRVVQAPALFLATTGSNAVLGGQGWDVRMGVLSLGSWILFTTMVLSFLQWFAIAHGVAVFSGWLSSRGNVRRPRPA